MQAELAAEGLHAGRDRIGRLRREMGLSCKQKRKFKATTHSSHSLPVAVNILGQVFSPTKPNEVWTGDITYIATDEGRLYLAGLKDVFTCEIVGYPMGERMTTGLVSQTLFRAVQQKRPPAGRIHHTDQANQYCAEAYRTLQVQFGMQTSMSRKGNCFDNSPIESFWGSLKNELVQHHRFKTRAEAKAAIQEYIEIFITANVGTHDLAMSARQNSPRDIGERLRPLDTGLSDLIRTPHKKREAIASHIVPLDYSETTSVLAGSGRQHVTNRDRRSLDFGFVCYLSSTCMPPRFVTMGHGFWQHLDIDQYRSLVTSCRPQCSLQFHLVVHPIAGTTVTLCVLGKINSYQRTIQNTAIRISISVFGTKTSHPLPHLQVINATKSCIVEQQDHDLQTLLYGRLQFCVQHQVGAVTDKRIDRLCW
ncbi:integrase catalytic subunit [Aeromonas hydrophila ML09-119]|nr:integrase catalytic subunit [Aeromonas hydrophila ML09-119]